MKEIYTAPKANLVGFEASEKLAASLEFDDLLDIADKTNDLPGYGDAGEPSLGDIGVPN